MNPHPENRERITVKVPVSGKQFQELDRQQVEMSHPVLDADKVFILQKLIPEITGIQMNLEYFLKYKVAYHINKAEELADLDQSESIVHFNKTIEYLRSLLIEDNNWNAELDTYSGYYSFREDAQSWKQRLDTLVSEFIEYINTNSIKGVPLKDRINDTVQLFLVRKCREGHIAGTGRFTEMLISETNARRLEIIRNIQAYESRLGLNFFETQIHPINEPLDEEKEIDEYISEIEIILKNLDTSTLWKNNIDSWIGTYHESEDLKQWFTGLITILNQEIKRKSLYQEMCKNLKQYTKVKILPILKKEENSAAILKTFLYDIPTLDQLQSQKYQEDNLTLSNEDRLREYIQKKVEPIINKSKAFRFTSFPSTQQN